MSGKKVESGDAKARKFLEMVTGHPKFSADQLHVVKEFVAAALPALYGDEWSDQRHRFLTEHEDDKHDSSLTATAAMAAGTATEQPKWIQCENKESPDYIAAFVTGWSDWQPYLRGGDPKRPLKNTASLFTQRWLTNNGWKQIPKSFGVYALGVLPPDCPVCANEIKPSDRADLERSVLIVNHGVVGGAATEANTLNRRLMTYATKVKPYEFAFGPWLELGFQVFVKWRVVHLDEETKTGLTSKAGAALRKGLETSALTKWKFHLNVSEQKSLKGKGVSMMGDPMALIVREEKAGPVTAARYRVPSGTVRTSMINSDKELLAAGDVYGLSFVWWLGDLSDRGKKPISVPVLVLGDLFAAKLVPLSISTDEDRAIVYGRASLSMRAKETPASATAAAPKS